MSRSSKLGRLMNEDLPSISYQRRMLYRTTPKEVLTLFKVLNREIFNNKLPIPKFEVVSNCREYWGFCVGTDFDLDETTKSNCLLRVSDKWYCKQWLITMLAHEMCHQYQWDIYSVRRLKRGLPTVLSHGPSFFKYKKKLARYGIPLRVGLSRANWFSYQDFFKC